MYVKSYLQYSKSLLALDITDSGLPVYLFLKMNNFKEDVNWKEVYELIKVDQTVEEVSWAEPGTEAGLQKLKLFCQSHLKNFAAQRNDPTKSALSNLSPWFHSGL